MDNPKSARKAGQKPNIPGYKVSKFPSAVTERTDLSLNRVGDLRTSSALVEQEAIQLREDLQNTQDLALEALQISTTAQQRIQDENAVSNPY